MYRGSRGIQTHKAIRPSEARLKTTFPSAATPPLWPWVRADKLRGSRVPTRPEGDRNWGEEHGPKEEVLRDESMLRRRRAFTLPWNTQRVRLLWLLMEVWNIVWLYSTAICWKQPKLTTKQPFWWAFMASTELIKIIIWVCVHCIAQCHSKHYNNSALGLFFFFYSKGIVSI